VGRPVALYLGQVDGSRSNAGRTALGHLAERVTLLAILDELLPGPVNRRGDAPQAMLDAQRGRELQPLGDICWRRQGMRLGEDAIKIRAVGRIEAPAPAAEKRACFRSPR
jgi:hypothetical protein